MQACGRVYGGPMELVELERLSEHDWAEVVAGEQQPFGPEGSQLTWREKERHVGLRSGDGRLLALAGVVIVAVEIAGAASFEVVGLGSVIVTRSDRGRGLMMRVVEPALRVAEGMGPDRAMLFCRPELVGLYKRVAFSEITAAVWVDQPGRRVELPMRAMWRPLREGVAWPPGRVDVRGLPF